MTLKDILAISGYNGLYRFISQGRNGIIIEGLTDKKRVNAASTSRVSALEDIAIYTTDKEVPLKDIFRSIFQKENGQQTIDPKSPNDTLKRYFETILPDYDKERVYTSDIKKVLTWYNLLLAENIINLDDDSELPEEKAINSESTETTNG